MNFGEDSGMRSSVRENSVKGDMKLAIMQPYFFPYIGFFQLMDAADKIILYDHVHFIKNGWIKRNRILEKNKGDVWIRVPVSDASSNKKIYEIEMDAKSCWQKKIVNLLEHNYKNAPYYHEIMPHLWPIFNKQYTLYSGPRNSDRELS